VFVLEALPQGDREGAEIRNAGGERLDLQLRRCELGGYSHTPVRQSGVGVVHVPVEVV